jgi:3-oxoacyl-[acyl-carrier protein] reductase
MEEVKKVALVTGAGRGIGREIALALASKGIDIAIADIGFADDSATLKAVKKMNCNAVEARMDVADPKSVESALETIEKELGPVNILINNAGITRDNLILRMSNDEWESVIKINLNGAFNCVKYVVKNMTKAKWGRIVNITSVVGQRGNAGQANYASSKAGLIGLTKSLAIELASRNITVNAVAPGFIDTDMTRILSEKVREMLLEVVPMKRLGTVKDIADAVKFLVSDEASYITGQVIAVNGGMYM